MTKPQQVLILEPEEELHFEGPFTNVVTSYLKLTNPTDHYVMFKVKTTAPKKYCVRPNGGILEPKNAVRVVVMLQPFDYNPTEKNKHKFMVQTMIVPDKDVPDHDALWREAKPESLMDSKLKCVFDMPGEEGVQNNNLDTNTVQVKDKTNASKIVPEPSFKASPKVTNSQSELKKLLEDNRRLKDECHKLKQENAQLQEEGLRLRTRANPAGDGGARSAGASHLGKSQTESLQTTAFNDKDQQSPMLYLAVILTIGLLGIFIGKFIV